MPIEVLILLAGLVVAAGILIFAHAFAATQRDSAATSLARLRQEEAWLQSRLRTAEREAWEESMHDALSAQLTAIQVQLAGLRDGTPRT